MNLKNIKHAFTLAEIVIVMIIIAVIVSVSLKLAKTKLDNVKSYTYFSAYQTLYTVSREMLYDFKSTDDNYINGITEYGLSCAEGSQPKFTAEDDDCVPSPTTVSRDGAHFCQLFASYTNTQTNGFADGQECQGSAFAGVNINDDVNFSDLRADIILKNGMRVYNLRSDPQPIEVLNGNSFDNRYFDTDSSIKDADITGYTVFIDTDGASGPSVLWQDIFPFYITMSGKVIPAYKDDLGGSNKEYLSVGASREFLSDTGRRYNWYAKNVSYKEAACVSGFIRAVTPYCTTAPAVGINAACSDADSNCTIQVFSPARFFN